MATSQVAYSTKFARISYFITKVWLERGGYFLKIVLKSLKVTSKTSINSNLPKSGGISLRAKNPTGISFCQFPNLTMIDL